jgi:hypothetical protein
MHLIITVTFTALLFVISIPQIAGFSYLFRTRDGPHYDDLLASERQIEDEDDRQIVNGNIQLPRLIESSSCVKDEQIRENLCSDF